MFVGFFVSQRFPRKPSGHLADSSSRGGAVEREREKWLVIDRSDRVGGTHLHAGSPTSLKNTHVPPFRQNASPITGHGAPECVQLFGAYGECPSLRGREKQSVR